MRRSSDTEIRAALYELYLALFRAHQRSPTEFHLGRVTTIHTAVMGLETTVGALSVSHPRRWTALQKSNSIKPSCRESYCRDHLVDRRQTAQILFQRKSPMSLAYFFRTFLANDDTVIMLAAQNPSRSHTFPAYIAFENPNCELFPNGSLMSWKHRSQERQFLRELHEQRRAQSRNGTHRNRA